MLLYHYFWLTYWCNNVNCNRQGVSLIFRFDHLSFQGFNRILDNIHFLGAFVNLIILNFFFPIRAVTWNLGSLCSKVRWNIWGVSEGACDMRQTWTLTLFFFLKYVTNVTTHTQVWVSWTVGGFCIHIFLLKLPEKHPQHKMKIYTNTPDTHFWGTGFRM